MSQPNHTGITKGRVATNKEVENSPVKSQLSSVASDIASVSEHMLATQQKLQKITQRVVLALEEERRACGQEIHDQIGQDLTLLNLALGQARKGDKPVDWASMQKMVSNIILKVRNFSFLLYGVNLDEVSLETALRDMLQAVTSGAEMEVDADLALTQSPPEEVGVTCYRLVQEALTNVLRHAGASQAQVRVWDKDAFLHVRVADNGIGFNPETASKSGGLHIMRRRVEMLGGKFNIAAGAEGGTEVQAALPLRHTQEREGGNRA